MSDDLISRQAVINAIHDEREWLNANIQSAQHHYHMMNETARILGIIGNLLAVQPKQKTGRWIWKKRRRVNNYTVERTSQSIYGVEFKELVIIHDEWIEDVNYCSVCGKRGDDTFFNYCPNCGAKMEGDNNDS